MLCTLEIKAAVAPLVLALVTAPVLLPLVSIEPGVGHGTQVGVAQTGMQTGC